MYPIWFWTTVGPPKKALIARTVSGAGKSKEETWGGLPALSYDIPKNEACLLLSFTFLSNPLLGKTSIPVDCVFRFQASNHRLGIFRFLKTGIGGLLQLESPLGFQRPSAVT